MNKFVTTHKAYQMFFFAASLTLGARALLTILGDVKITNIAWDSLYVGLISFLTGLAHEDVLASNYVVYIVEYASIYFFVVLAVPGAFFIFAGLKNSINCGNFTTTKNQARSLLIATYFFTVHLVILAALQAASRGYNLLELPNQ